jgi:hypothetical protein
MALIPIYKFWYSPILATGQELVYVDQFGDQKTYAFIGESCVSIIGRSIVEAFGAYPCGETEFLFNYNTEVPIEPVEGEIDYNPKSLNFIHSIGNTLPSSNVFFSGDDWKIIGKPNFVLSSPTAGVTIVNNVAGGFQTITGSGNATITITLGSFYNSKDVFSPGELSGSFEVKNFNIITGYQLDGTIDFTIVINKLSDFFQSPYLDKANAFTLDNKYFEVFSAAADTYFQFDTTIKVYDFFTNTERVHTIPQKLVLFKGKAKINIGKLIHRLMDNFELPNANLVQYKTADVQIYCAEKKQKYNNVVRSGTSPVIKFVAGLSRGITNTGILDFNLKPNRVTKNSFAYINILIPKPVNCVVSEWSAWSQCIDSSQSRTRTIITPALYGGTACPVLSETQSCAMPVNCVVSEWSDWSECVDGTQTRTRTVITPASNGGTACPVLSESQSCEVAPTPVNCVVSDWSAWSECVDGTQTRTRTVITPASNGGTACPVLSESRSCEVAPTPVNCVVSDWSAWSECVDGSQTRTRTVITPASNGGTACPVLTETRSCSIVCINYNVEIPEVDTVTISYYDCNNNPVVLEPLTGPDAIQFCAKEGTVLRVPDNTSVITLLGNCQPPQPVNCVVSDWSDWSECVEGSQTRTRTVITPASNGGTACPVLSETRSCEPVVDCVVSEWSAWSTCSEGFRTRTRTVITPASGGGTACPVLTETETCSTIGVTSTICNDTDGGSTVTKRFRISIGDAPTGYTIQAGTVTNPAGLNYSIVPTVGDAYIQVEFKPFITFGNEFSIELLLKNSSGVTVATTVSQTLYGNYQSFLPSCQSPQPVNCVVSDWSAWSECVDGSQTRTRTVITPASNGGTACPVLSETRSCEPVVDCVVSEWSDWSTCTNGSQTRTRTVITPASGGGTACPVLTESRSCTQTVRLSYAVNLSGGISMGGFSINANGVNVFSTNSTDSGYVDVPINSEISVVIYAPVGDTTNGQTPSFYSKIIAGSVDSGLPTNNSTSSITFIATEDVSIEAAASVSSNGENVIQ